MLIATFMKGILVHFGALKGQVGVYVLFLGDGLMFLDEVLRMESVPSASQKSQVGGVLKVYFNTESIWTWSYSFPHRGQESYSPRS